MDKSINIGDSNPDGGVSIEQTLSNSEGMGDVQAGIEFIYHMREHIVDVGVATLYLFACYAFYLWLKKVIQ